MPGLRQQGRRRSLEKRPGDTDAAVGAAQSDQTTALGGSLRSHLVTGPPTQRFSGGSFVPATFTEETTNAA